MNGFPSCLVFGMRTGVDRNTKIEQVWFAGNHSNVGGGDKNSALSNLALDWIMTRASEHGLIFRIGLHEEVKRNAYASGPMNNTGKGQAYRYGSRDIEVLSKEKLRGNITIHSSVLETHKREDRQLRTGKSPGNI